MICLSALAVSRMFGGVIIVLEVFRGDLERRGWVGGVMIHWSSRFKSDWAVNSLRASASCVWKRCINASLDCGNRTAGTLWFLESHTRTGGFPEMPDLEIIRYP